MPAVQDIRRAYPEARIDWVVERGFAPLVQRCEGVARVIPCELRRWRKAPFAAHDACRMGRLQSGVAGAEPTTGCWTCRA